jgi:beta-glucosidase
MDLIKNPGPGHHRTGELPLFEAPATEGVRVGYKWFESKQEQPLFPFGFGLSYTTYEFSDLKASEHEVTFTVRNSGNRAGTEVAQVYAVLPASTGESTFKRLIAWDRVALAAGESKTVTLKFDPIYLSIFDVGKNKFVLAPGDYEILAGSSSHDTTLNTTVHIAE